ncbi:MAG: TIGR04211 family SH3 domain-containing protein [Desulfobacterales bacterium]|nr:TIGR04211 family SH3 domain-containing protein [Desulfobacterales bacterium]
MKKVTFIGICLFLFCSISQAETLYISDFLRITMRTGPGIDHKIIEMIKSGQSVTVLEQGPEWTKILLPTGKEGWVLNRFLTPKPPSGLLLKKLEEKHAELSLQITTFIDENKRLRNENQRLDAELKTSSRNLKKVTDSYQKLKSGSAEYLDVKSRYEMMVVQLDQQKKRAQDIEKELESIRFHKNIRWFLSGAVVLIIGFLIGFSARHQRRRSSLL